ncbi:hypothetical protein [Sulfurimonas sp. C5]|uniref:hypothetical protein n=1 Tax=Sulfurimonas sp. C5 TaxID=3036947 RepID=UPI002454254A|nr:hypothetical protein [Sulfurimonas sp. C5]MDH4944181.1 hypothetical protein [Sulfurimonas sp. C5]
MLIIPLFTLDAKEPTMLMLKGNLSNALQEFQVLPDYSFQCKPYGITTVDELLNSKKTTKECKNVLKKFYVQNPELYNLHYHVLHRKSFYHLEYENKSCIIYAKGELTYSEILLKEGAALIQKDLKNEVFEPRFQSAQRSAELRKKGIFKDPNVLRCVTTD